MPRRGRRRGGVNVADLVNVGKKIIQGIDMGRKLGQKYRPITQGSKLLREASKYVTPKYANLLTTGADIGQQVGAATGFGKRRKSTKKGGARKKRPMRRGGVNIGDLFNVAKKIVGVADAGRRFAQREKLLTKGSQLLGNAAKYLTPKYAGPVMVASDIGKQLGSALGAGRRRGGVMMRPTEIGVSPGYRISTYGSGRRGGNIVRKALKGADSFLRAARPVSNFGTALASLDQPLRALPVWGSALGTFANLSGKSVERLGKLAGYGRRRQMRRK